jgi:hypothetical protein
MISIPRNHADGKGKPTRAEKNISQRPVLFPPTGLAPALVLEPHELAAHANNVEYAGHTIVRLLDGDGAATINREWLLEVTGKNFNKIFRRMEERAEIILVDKYQKGVVSSRYTLPEHVLNNGVHLTFPVNPHFVHRLMEYHRKLEEYRRQSWKPIHFRLDQHLSELWINLRSAERDLRKWKEHQEGTSPYVAQHGKILRLAHHRAGIISIDDQTRVHTTITSMKKCLRRHIRWGRSPLVSVDLTACQPTLLIDTVFWLLLKHPWIAQGFNSTNGPSWWQYRKYSWGSSEILSNTPTQTTGTADTEGRRTHTNVTLPNGTIRGVFHGGGLSEVEKANGSDGGVRLWAQLSANGQLYEHFAERTGIGRDECKILLLQDFIAKRPFKEGRPERRCDYPSAIERVVRQDFPAVYYAVRWLSRDNHGETIRHLQRHEAELVVERACVNVPDGIPVTPIFDCLVGRVQDQKLLEDALDQAGRETGIPVKYKAKHWS